MEGANGGLDAKGLASHVVPYYVATLEEAKTVGEAPLGLGEQGRKWSNHPVGGYQVDVTYQGRGREVSDDGDVYSFDSSFAEEPLTSHPDWDVISKTYGAIEKDGKLTFPKEMPSGTTSGTSKGSGKGKLNPLYGLSTYLVLRAVFRRTRIVDSIPDDLLSSVGSVKSSLPGGLPTPADHNWLIMPPKASKKGNVYEIQDEWTMSKKGGWPAEVYNLIEF